MVSVWSFFSFYQMSIFQVLLEEGGVKLSLTVVDTPGFGDAVDNTDCWEPVTNFVENQFEKFLDAETRVNRVELPDNRVHACLYFIAPSGHGLKPLDIEFMKRLHNKVNIIPVIGKADACTPEELKYFKEKVINSVTITRSLSLELSTCISGTITVGAIQCQHL